MNNIVSVMNNYELKISSATTNFLDNHWYFSMKASLLISIWLILSISVISMAGIVGMDQIKKTNENNYIAGQMPEQDYNFWKTFMNPIFDLILITMNILSYIIIAIALYFGLYRPVKRIISITN